jgi:hypothetical protein
MHEILNGCYYLKIVSDKGSRLPHPALEVPRIIDFQTRRVLELYRPAARGAEGVIQITALQGTAVQIEPTRLMSLERLIPLFGEASQTPGTTFEQGPFQVRRLQATEEVLVRRVCAGSAHDPTYALDQIALSQIMYPPPI